MGRPLSLPAVLAALVGLLPAPLAAQSLDDLITSNLTSKGGLEKIKATTTVRMTGTVVARDPSGQELTGTMTMVAKRPNLMRRDVVVAGRQVVNAFDGTTLWMKMDSMAPLALPGPQAAYARQDAEFDSVFVDYREKGHKIELVGQDTIDGRPVYHVRVTKKGGLPQDFYLDAATGLERRIRVSLQSPDGAQVTNVTEFSDYRSVDGRLVPFQTRQTENGKLKATITLDKVEFNEPLDDSFFSMPAR